MSEWQMLHQYNVFQPEIRMGLYEVWVAGIEPGLSQAERVLVHSPMLEQAHERRFVVSELGLDHSTFEAEHAKRITYALSTLDHRFVHHPTAETDIPSNLADEDLLGVSTMVHDDFFPARLEIERPSTTNFTKQPQAVSFQQRSDCSASTTTSTSSRAVGWPASIEIDDEPYWETDHEMFVRADFPRYSSNTTRLLNRPARIRRFPATKVARHNSPEASRFHGHGAFDTDQSRQ